MPSVSSAVNSPSERCHGSAISTGQASLFCLLFSTVGLKTIEEVSSLQKFHASPISCFQPCCGFTSSPAHALRPVRRSSLQTCRLPHRPEVRLCGRERPLTWAAGGGISRPALNAHADCSSYGGAECRFLSPGDDSEMARHCFLCNYSYMGTHTVTVAPRGLLQLPLY